MARSPIRGAPPVAPNQVVSRPGFGVTADRGGYTISNKETIFGDLISAICRDKGFSPESVKTGFLVTHGSTSFSHAVPIFRDPDTQVLMVANIRGGGDAPLVNLMPLHEYVFGNERFRDGNPQRGAYNSPMTLMLCFDESVDAGAMKQRALDLKVRNEAGDAQFDLLLPRVRNVLRQPFETLGVLSDKEYGNCARYSTSILTAGGALPQRGRLNRMTIWPNRLPLRIKERFGERAVVIDIPRIEHAEHTLKAFKGKKPHVNPLTSLRRALTGKTRYEQRVAATPSYALVVPPGDVTAPEKLNIAAKVVRSGDSQNADLFEE